MNVDIICVMLNLIVLTGGCGLEHSVSISSANNFVSNIDSTIFNYFLVTISKTGDWLFENMPCLIIKEDVFFLVTNYNTRIKIDFILPIVHGKGAENGELQGFFSSIGFDRLISNSLYSSCVSFDKILAKKIAESLGISTISHIDLSLNFYNFIECSNLLKSNFLFLKPADNGSSFGCQIVKTQEEFDYALSEIYKISKVPMVEKYLDMIECSCSVLFDEVSDVITIDHGLSFFSYDDKYLKHSFKVNYLNDQILISKIKNYSLKLFKAMRFNLFCRFDFFICKISSQIYFNEANSLPGLGEESLFFFSFALKYTQKDIVNKILMSIDK